MRWCLVGMVLATISCSARVYTPCDLAHFFKFYYSSYIPEKYVPLAVCIAGYHNYSKSNELRHPDGRISYGYFGLMAKPECPKEILTDDSYFSGDWKCLKSQVIDVPEKLKLYEKLCGPKWTKKITCRFNEYFEFAEVLDPIHKDILALSYGEERVIDKMLASFNITDDQQVTTSTINELQENPSIANIVHTTQEIHGTPTESQLIKNRTPQETTHDITISHYVQDYTKTLPILPESRKIEQTDDQFCFTARQITAVICTTLLAQTLLLMAAVYVLTKLWKHRNTDRQNRELKLFSFPTSPPMEEFLRKPFPEGPSQGL